VLVSANLFFPVAKTQSGSTFIFYEEQGPDVRRQQTSQSTQRGGRVKDTQPDGVGNGQAMA